MLMKRTIIACLLCLLCGSMAQAQKIRIKTGIEVLELLKQLNNEGNTIVLITHDNSIAHQAKRMIQIHDGKVVSDTLN